MLKVVAISALFLFNLITGSVLMAQENKPIPPTAEKRKYIETIHGIERVDNYYWLREKTNPEVINYLEQENSYTEVMTEHLKDNEEKLYNEFLSRIQETDLSVPVKIGEYYYYSRTEEGKNYSIYCRKKGSLEAEEEILLDLNEYADKFNYLRLGVFEVSPNQQLLAYSLDTDGSEDFRLYIKDLNTNTNYEDVLTGTAPSVEWANDNKTLFYVVLDYAKRPYKLFRHNLGEKQENDVEVFEEKDERFFLRFSKTKNNSYLVINLISKTSSEVWYLDADRPDDDFSLFSPRVDDVQYFIENYEDKFYIMTDEDARNFKLMVTEVGATERNNWTELLPHRTDAKIDGMAVFNDYFVLYERVNGLRQIRISDHSVHNYFYVEFPEEVYTFFPSRNPDFNTDLLRFTYTSLITPNTVYDFNMKEKSFDLKKQDEVLGSYNPNDYSTYRLNAPAEDGTLIPISIIYKKGIEKNGKNPLFLYAYGSYGSSSEPTFNSIRLSLLERGFIYAIAHIRGGGEMGRQWYDDGKLLNKKNTFTDFINCAEFLIEQNYTNNNKLVISGGSAGGLLMGAVVNMRPDLFKFVIAKVPFVDVVNTMLDETIPLTVTEFEEWGNPKIKEYYDYMMSYSPYDNIEAKSYPDLLITAGLNDPRVQYWEPAKWTAKLREMKTDNNLLLLKTNMGAGHGGPSGRYAFLRELAFEYALIFDRLNINPF